MSKHKSLERRRQFWVDPKIQGSFVLRVVLYWVVCLLSVGLVLLLVAALGDPRSPVNAASRMLFDFYVPAVLASLLVLPVIVLDSIRYSHRIAGAGIRFHRAMQRLAEGETASPLVVREGDSWKRLADHFNRIALRLEELENAQLNHAPLETNNMAPTGKPDEAIQSTGV